MQFLLLLAGIILLATHGWFTGQHIVGTILVIAFAVLTVVQLIVAHFARKLIRTAHSEVLRGIRSRNRRGF